MEKKTVVFGLFFAMILAGIPAIGNADTWRSIAAGNYHTLAVRGDGTLWAWGRNDTGQLGLGDTRNRSVPTRIGNATNWESVSAGRAHSTAIRTDGSLWAWGCNCSGKLGDGTTNHRSAPVQIGRETSWRAVSAGGGTVVGRGHTVAISRDGALWAWGDNSHGQLGNDTTTRRFVPTRIGGATHWVSISSGDNHTVAITRDNSIWTWGWNQDGQLGDGGTASRATPISIRTGALENWAYVIAGDRHTVAVRRDGSLWAWGSNEHGQFGDGGSGQGNRRSNPVLIEARRGMDWTTVSAGLRHTVGIGNDGTLWAWGGNTFGQLGNGTATDRTTPVRIGMYDGWEIVAAGGSHTLALRRDGSLWAWGNNEHGQLGNGGGGSGDRRLVPTRIMP